MKRNVLYPRTPLLVVIAIGAGAGLAAALLRLAGDAAWLAFSATLEQTLIYGVIGCAGIAAWDALQVMFVRGFTANRRVPHTLSLDAWTEVQLEVHHPLGRRARIDIFDHHPDGADTEFLPGSMELKPGVSSTTRYRMRPEKRGTIQFGQLELLLPSPLGLWQARIRCGEQTSVRVYPDFAAITRYALLAIDNHTSQLGIRKKPRRGEGQEFHQLREYRQGDSLRQIDWKATARRQQLISREYQDERDQQIYFMIDCGRGMRTQDGHLSHFDHALNCFLLLGYVAVRQGDAVGLMSFGGERRWMPAQKSAVAVNTMLNTVFDLHPTTHASDYSAAARELLARQRKRALIVMITNLRDESSEDLLPALQLLGRHHRVLLAGVREEILDHTLQRPVVDFDDALDYTGVIDHLAQRQETRKKLQNSGILTLDVTPGHLSAQVVNSYLEIKRSNCL